MRTTFYVSALQIILATLIFSQSIVELNSTFSSAVSVLYMSKTNTLFAGGDIGFFKTTDLGQTWDTLLTQNTRSIYLYNDSLWYLCTYGGIFKTTDSGTFSSKNSNRKKEHLGKYLNRSLIME